MLPDQSDAGAEDHEQLSPPDHEAAGLPVSSHIFPEFSFHLLGVTPTGQWLEYLDIGSNILMEPLRIQDGYAVMPNRPGSGLAWNEEAVKRWLVYEAPSP